MPLDGLCVCMRDWMWRNENNDYPKKTKGLIAVAACNHKGVPDQGAEKCLRALLQEFPPDSPVCSKDEINRAWYGSKTVGRENCTQLLRVHWEYHNECVDEFGLPLHA